jgi:FMN phosphatase YigB (HAD superfamily)
MILLLDWDGTLWNSKVFQQQIFKELHERFNITSKMVHDVLDKYSHDLINPIDFSPKSFCKFLSVSFTISESSLIDIFLENEQIYKKSLYKDTEEFLIFLSKKKDTKIGIYSEGVISFQENKIVKSGMFKYFDPSLIYIFKRKMEKGVLDTIPKDSLIIDNKQHIVDELNKFGFNAKLIDRPRQTLFDVFIEF